MNSQIERMTKVSDDELPEEETSEIATDKNSPDIIVERNSQRSYLRFSNFNVEAEEEQSNQDLSDIQANDELLVHTLRSCDLELSDRRYWCCLYTSVMQVI